ncbi:MAG TPA: SGNH/GDSL hydrolase family protein [Nocardioidaceae bacterium]|nr:SGNH/GDSL hydrolase family protein [Nocardioidaceae bacterium]
MAVSKVALVGLALPVAGAVVLARQGASVRRTALRLPEALGPDHDHPRSSGTPLNLYVVGDSVAAAVGLDHHSTSLAGRLGDLLALEGPVRRRVLAVSGFDAAQARQLVEGRLSDADVVVVSIGVNDTKNLHSRRRWRTELGALLDSVTRQAPQARVVLLGIPPMERFPALPTALGLVLGVRSRLMDRVGREVATRYPTVRRLDLPRSEFTVLQDPFARDGFHPSEAMHELFATRIRGLLDEMVGA